MASGKGQAASSVCVVGGPQLDDALTNIAAWAAQDDDTLALPHLPFAGLLPGAQGVCEVSAAQASWVLQCRQSWGIGPLAVVVDAEVPGVEAGETVHLPHRTVDGQIFLVTRQVYQLGKRRAVVFQGPCREGASA